jgi:hypothetical protein
LIDLLFYYWYYKFLAHRTKTEIPRINRLTKKVKDAVVGTGDCSDNWDTYAGNPKYIAFITKNRGISIYSRYEKKLKIIIFVIP